MRACFDRLAAFTFSWAFIGLIQCVKCYHSGLISSLDLVLFIFLICGIIAALLRPINAASPLTLCSMHLLSHIFQGSQSNHVLVAMSVNLAILLNYSTNRQAWTQRAAGTIYLLLLVLYLIPCLHKLNTDWFNPQVSCASLFTSGILSNFFPLASATTSPIVLFLVHSAPYQAIAIELGLPLLLVVSRFLPSRWSTRYMQLFITLACIFHLFLSLPFPPMSVYPFSMVMYPMFLLLLNDEAIQHTYSRCSALHPLTIAASIAILAFGLEESIKRALADEPMPSEYPPYELYKPAIVWSLLTILALLAATFTKQQATATPSTLRFTVQGTLLAAALALIGMGPYLDLRNYPALAMFSNLRTEGTRNNHLFMPTLPLLGIQKNTITIHDTNLLALRHYQLNLADTFTTATRAFNTALNVSNEFYITPPRVTLKHRVDKPFREYSIPLLEFRRRIHEVALMEEFYVMFTLNSEEVKQRLSSVEWRQGRLSTEMLALLGKRLHWLEFTLVRFRSFDENYSPCRH